MYPTAKYENVKISVSMDGKKNEKKSYSHNFKTVDRIKAGFSLNERPKRAENTPC